MNDFTASNGLSVQRSDTGGIRVEYPEYPADPEATRYIPSAAAEAVTEFVRAEEDKRFGRWRYPEIPEYVVYPHPEFDPLVRVVNVATGNMRELSRAKAGHKRTEFERAAAAFFDAHPEPKPATHDAKPWETWVITFRGEEWCVMLDEDLEFRDHDHKGALPAWVHITDEAVTAGRRIWPEVTS